MEVAVLLAAADPANLANPDRQEAEVVARAVEGDPEAFSHLLTIYRRRILRLAYTIVRDPDLAEDAAQESFIRAFRAIRSFRGPEGFYTWLCRIAVRVCSDCLRRDRSRLRLSATADPLPSHTVAPHDVAVERMAVEALLDQLSPVLRAALVLREVDGLEYEEIARSLGIPVGTVRSRLHAARERFRDLYLGSLQKEANV